MHSTNQIWVKNIYYNLLNIGMCKLEWNRCMLYQNLFNRQTKIYNMLSCLPINDPIILILFKPDAVVCPPEDAQYTFQDQATIHLAGCQLATRISRVIPGTNITFLLKCNFTKNTKNVHNLFLSCLSILGKEILQLRMDKGYMDFTNSWNPSILSWLDEIIELRKWINIWVAY